MINFFILSQWKMYATNITIPFSTGVNSSGEKIFLKDIWPTRNEIQAVERQFVIPGMFKEVYQKIEVN